MYCTNCGNEINENAVVCIHCGTAVDKEYFEKHASMKNAAQNPQPARNFEPVYNAEPVYQAEPVKEKKDNAIAIVGFIFAFFMPIVGLICSAIGYKRAKHENGEHKELALAGVIISTIELVAALVIGLIYGFLLVVLAGVIGAL